jgi:hypothetical protein
LPRAWISDTIRARLGPKVQGPDRRKFLELGVQGTIAKPFDPLTLGAQIHEVLGWHDAEAVSSDAA